MSGLEHDERSAGGGEVIDALVLAYVSERLGSTLTPLPERARPETRPATAVATLRQPIAAAVPANKPIAHRLKPATLSSARVKRPTGRPVMLSASTLRRVRPAFADLAVVSRLPILTVPVLPEPSPSIPVRAGGYLLWPDAKARTVWFTLATLARVDFTLMLEQSADFTIGGGSATLTCGLFPPTLPHDEMRGWGKVLQRAGIATSGFASSQWRFEPLALSRLDASLELPDGHLRTAPQVTSNPRLGTAVFLIELSSLGAQVWRQSIDGGSAPPGLCRFVSWYLGGQADRLAARSHDSGTTLASLLQGVAPEAVRSVNTEIQVDATLHVGGDPTIETMTLELQASNGTVRTETFDGEGGALTMRMLVEDPSKEHIDWQVRVVFAAAAWPPLRLEGTLSNETGWSELLAPSSWLRSVSLTTMLIGSDGAVLPSDTSDPDNRVSGAVDFTAPYLEGSSSLHTGFETSSRESTTVLMPRPPFEPPGALKLTVFALRDGLDSMSVHDLEPDEEWVVVKVYANARIEVVTNRSPAAESTREEASAAAARALDALHRR